MVGLLIVLVTLIVLIAIAAPVVFFQVQKKFREQKNYERGLKIVPLLIHLPPPSDDTEIGGRDARDVTEETISKAQIIYDIIASTLQKGFKSTFYGQRHFAFEIVGSHGFVYFYAAVPIALLDVVKQAIVSAYPTARLEEVAEHNIFNQVGRSAGTLGGELSLKEPFAYPIAVYKESRRDGMQALLNALSTLGKEDGAAIQILMRPANPGWRKTATAVASTKRKGGDTKSTTAYGVLKSIVVAFNKPPHGNGKDSEAKKPELSNLDQSILDAVDDKTRYPGYEVLIRVVASSNVSQQAQAILGNIVASFSLYDAPGKNGFKYTPAKDVDGLVTSYIMRFFPPEQKKNILNVVELATLFHFPDQRHIPTSQLTRQDSKQVDGPRNIPEEGVLLGYNVFRGAKKPIRLGLSDRQRHIYAVGQTGTGKSTFLENLALQDMLSGGGFAFVDPHGDVVDKLLAMVPKERTEDVIYFSPAEMDYPMGLNLFEFHTPDQKDFLIQEALNMLYKLYDPQHQGIMGPRYEHLFRNAALTIMADPEGGTFVDIPKLFRDPQYVKQKLQHVKDQNVIEFWQKEMPASQRSNEFGEVVSWFVSKFGAFLSNEMMRNIIGQTKSAFDLRDIMDNKKILLVNLSKGRTGDLNSKLLGMVFVMKFQAAAMSRANIPEDDRVDFSLYVDEFQNFSTDSFATIMSEARKYHLNLIVANQFTTQLTPEIRDAVFGNIGTIVSFRVGQGDVDSLGKYFEPIFDVADLLRVPNFNTIVRTMIGGVPTQPFSMATLPALGTPNPRLAEALKQLSAAKYGKPKNVVEQAINARMITKEAAKPSGYSAGAPGSAAGPAGASVASAAGRNQPARPWPPAPTGGAQGGGYPPAARSAPASASATGASAAPTTVSAPAPAPAPKGTSFLDEWLDKRRRGVPTPDLKAVNSRPAAPGTSPAPAAASQSTVVSAPAVTAAPAAAKPAPAPAPAAEGNKNISSGATEQSEVDKIAAELHQQLDSKENAAELLNPEPAPIPVAAPGTTALAAKPAPAPTPPPAPKKEDTINLNGSGHGDTIYIDREGVFHSAGDSAGSGN